VDGNPCSDKKHQLRAYLCKMLDAVRVILRVTD
jgi:hypothetical protein